VIVAQPEGKMISKEAAENCFNNNSDGCGLAYVTKGAIKIHKGYKTFPSFWKGYTKLVARTDSPLILHFRIATHGPTNTGNMHPFLSTGGSAFAHNGTMHQFKDKIDGFSDSRTMSQLLKNLKVDVLTTDGNILVTSMLGDSSKGVFLLPDKTLIIFNAKKGEMYDDVWFSNDSYRKRKVKSSQNTSVTSSIYNQCQRCGIYKKHLPAGASCADCISALSGKVPHKKCYLCLTQLTLVDEEEEEVCMLCWDELDSGEEVVITPWSSQEIFRY